MASTVSLKNSTLNTQANELALPEGSLKEAKNVVIDRDDTVQSRRGFKEYGGTTASAAKQLLVYKERILQHYGSSLRVDDGNGVFANISGSYPEVEAGLRIKGLEANSNFYFTTSTGIKKIVAQSASDLNASTVVETTGTPAGIDLEGTTNYNSDNPPFLTGDSAVAYRVVWGKKDGNDNLLLGAPSQRTVVINSLLTQLNLDFDSITKLMDFFGYQGSLFNSVDYFSSYDTRDPSVQGLTEAIYNVTTTGISGLVQRMDFQLLGTAASPITSNIFTVTGGQGARYAIGDKIRLTSQTGTTPRNFVFLVTNVSGDNLTVQAGPRTFDADYTSAGSPSIYKIKYSDVAQSQNTFTDISVAGVSGDATRIKVTFQAADKIAGYCVGDTITVSGATIAAYNGSFVLDRVEYDIVNNKYEMEYYVSTNVSTDTNVCNVTLSTKFPTSMPEIPVIADVLATNQELTQIKSALEQIVILLGSEPDAVISAPLKTYLDDLVIDAGATVDLKFGIPEGIDSTYFYQIYRSSIATLEGTTLTISDLTASDELRLAVEDFPSADQLTNGYVTYEDFTPSEFVDQNQNLYTNPISGGGIADANEAPPLATDLARFRDVIFYSNTKTKHTKTVTLLGVAGMLRDLDSGTNPTFTVSDSTTSNTYTFRKGVAQIQQINTAPGVPTNGDYFFLYSANRPGVSFRVYYTTGVIPAPIANTEFIIVDISTYAHTVTTIANATTAALRQYPSDFYVTNSGTLITIEQVVQGYVDAAGDSGGSGATNFNFLTPSPYGVGERIFGGENTVKIEDSASSAIAIDQTARSLCRIINQNPSEIVNAYYLSDGSTSPGIIQLKRRDLTDSTFYITTNTEDTGQSFNPILSPYKPIAGVNAALNALTITAHGLVAGDQFIISGNLSTPKLDGVHTVLSVFTADDIIISTDITLAGTVYGAITKLADAEKSESLGAKNRVYYSKFQQPEAVPLVNYFDVGPKDKAIKRIVALRDSLFIFKEEAVYRVGDTQPFFPTLFDSSVQVIGPDTIDVLNNQIYVFADSGINIISESGTSLASRNIYFDLTKAATYANNFTASFGVSYESDSAYLVFLCSRPDISVADICYRYNVITQAWTTFDRSQTCGIINNNKLYMGAGKKNTLHIERKDFSRKDYADEELAIDIQGASISQNKIFFPTVTDYAAGDSVIQYQTVTQYEFNTLNNKLANDPGMPAGFDKVTASIGSNMNLKLQELVTELDSVFSTASKTITSIGLGVSPLITLSTSHNFSIGDKIEIAGSNSTPTIDSLYLISAVNSSNSFTIDRSGPPVTVAGTAGTVEFDFIASQVGTINSNDSFATMQTKYNTLIYELNKSGLLQYANYSQSVGEKEFEIKVSVVNKSENSVTFTSMPQIINGAATLYKAFSTSVIYAPTIMGDPISLKHVREAQLFTENRSFTSFMSKFSSDLSPSYESVTFSGAGPGTFGTVSFGQGYFGGGSNAAPLRTFIPRNKQRCRFIRVGFEHKSALEEWKVYGMSLTFEPTGSTRAYR